MQPARGPTACAGCHGGASTCRVSASTAGARGRINVPGQGVDRGGGSGVAVNWVKGVGPGVDCAVGRLTCARRGPQRGGTARTGPRTQTPRGGASPPAPHGTAATRKRNPPLRLLPHRRLLRGRPRPRSPPLPPTAPAGTPPGHPAATLPPRASPRRRWPLHRRGVPPAHKQQRNAMSSIIFK